MAVHLVCYAGIASPGHSYSMSSSYWVNTGTEPETLVFRVDPPAGASWIKMEEAVSRSTPGRLRAFRLRSLSPPGQPGHLRGNARSLRS